MEAIRELYPKARLKEKGTIWGEAVRVTGRHRKSLIRALRARLDPYPDKNRPGPGKYGPEAVLGLKAVWEASDRICGKRLQLFLAELTEVPERQGEMSNRTFPALILGNTSADAGTDLRSTLKCPPGDTFPRRRGDRPS